VMPRKRKSKSRPHARKGLWLIAAFKFFKGLVLLAVGIGALSLLHEDAAAQVTHWVSELGVDPQNHYVHKLIRKLWTVDDAKLEAISLGTFFYAALMLTEGIGLALRKRWAEYFTIIATSSFIPLEIYELFKHFSLTKVAVILLNVAIVIYLVVVLRQHDD
jgi:uncharacterized membrane protein (DUF2068 family)